jgi:hypothetical protein
MSAATIALFMLGIALTVWLVWDYRKVWKERRESRRRNQAHRNKEVDRLLLFLKDVVEHHDQVTTGYCHQVEPAKRLLETYGIKMERKK